MTQVLVARLLSQVRQVCLNRRLVDKKTAVGETPTAVSVIFQPAMDFKVKNCVNPKSETKVTAISAPCSNLR